MLTSMVLHLESPAAATLPSSLGRAVQALLLRLVHDGDPALATALHDAEGPRPCTASNLVLGKRRGGSLPVQAGDSGWLRFTGLTEPVSRCLLALAENQADRPSPRVSLEFASPTTFRSGGRYVPLPLPDLVFGSLLDRWQAFAPIALSPEVRRFAAEAVAVSQYQLRTRSLPAKGGGVRVGFTGRASFVALNRDRYWLSVLHLLAAFAFYGGVGYQTAAGMGQVRLLDR